MSYLIISYYNIIYIYIRYGICYLISTGRGARTGASNRVLARSAILAARRNKKAISMDEINDATDRVIAGLEGRALADNSSKKLIAYHEAGERHRE